MSGRSVRGGVDTRNAHYSFHVEHGDAVPEGDARAPASSRAQLTACSTWNAAAMGGLACWLRLLAQVRARFHVEHADAMGVLACAASTRSTWNVGDRSGTPTRRLSVPRFWVAPHHVFHVERGRGSSKRMKPRGPPLLGLPVHGCAGRLAHVRFTLLVPRGTRTRGVRRCACAVHRQFHMERGHGSGANSRGMEELGHVPGSVARVPRGTKKRRMRCFFALVGGSRSACALRGAVMVVGRLCTASIRACAPLGVSSRRLVGRMRVLTRGPREVDGATAHVRVAQCLFHVERGTG